MSAKSNKKVRFALFDPNPLSMYKPIVTNTYQPSIYCNICGSTRYGQTTQLGNFLNKFQSNSSINLTTDKESTNAKKRMLTINPKNTITQQIEKNLINDFENSMSLSNDNPVPKPRKLSDPSKIEFRCFNCNEKFRPGEIAISAEHVDEDARWHTKCFTCHICNDLLVDLLYFSKEKKIYCQKHFNESEKKTKIFCAACDQSILQNEFIKAEKNFWHVDHFVCWNCESSLGGKKYLIVDSKPYCLECHSDKFAKKCNTCRKKIKPDIVRLTFDNLDWHAESECFKCFACNKNLLETHFILKKNLLFCSLDCKNKTSII